MDTFSNIDRSPTASREDAGRPPFDGYRRRSPGKISEILNPATETLKKSNSH